jgi:hypothetical protein
MRQLRYLQQPGELANVVAREERSGISLDLSVSTTVDGGDE